MKERISWLVNHAPKVSKEDIAAINDLFPAYIFRCRKTREIWTSCCGKHERLEKEHPVLKAEHRREPSKYRYWREADEKLTAKIPCPYCGKKAAVKEIGRIGEGKNLWTFRRVIVLRFGGGAMWGLGFDCTKAYGREWNWTAVPRMHLHKIYRFAPGRAEYIGRGYWDSGAFGNYYEQRKMLYAGWKFPDGFQQCSEYGTGYDLIDLTEKKGSWLEHCGLEKYEGGNPMKYLALYSIYPRQTEMLMKSGLDCVVDDMLRGVTNKRLFDWDVSDVCKSFKLDKKELRAWMTEAERWLGDGKLELLRNYKRMKKSGKPAEFEEIGAFQKALGVWSEKAVVRAAKSGVSLKRLGSYLHKERGGMSLIDTANGWCDYIDAAVLLGLNLKNPVFAMPKDLQKHHDEATEKAGKILAAKRDKENAERERIRCRNLTKKYTFWNDRYLIRPPVGANEIVAEGKRLKHCVGGCADRHVNGDVTILFLRDKKRQGKPLVTIEMRRESIVQIHGWDDERTPCRENPKRESPRKLYRDFLDEWLAWLEAGSKRKKGIPVIPKTKGAKTA